MTIAAEPLTDFVADLGEGPIWSAASQTIYWIDVTERKVFRHSFETGVSDAFAVSGMPGSIALCANGDLLAAFRSRAAIVSLESGREEELEGGADFSIERFNDGKCDRRGRFFVGSMDRATTNPVGGLYRIDLDRSVTRVANGMTLSNGIAWSPDDRVMYHCESRPGYVYAYNYDIDSGTPANRRIHIDLSSSPYRPDGCTIDAEGCLWIAEVGAGCVGRYAPDGRRIAEIKLPTQRVTSVIFGGRHLDTLFITTMRHKMTPGDLAEQPHSGRLFVARPGVIGLPEHRYEG
jgi:L-arabinonolactonase